ncbi:hypothetical protein M501DRAFT_1014383 [Patellaria atrata CBS 101060]|uniref:Uncharacterized protein n=1 Tax=Patellaria atrata CBS 101060 TaxID=1346257 RepID=A0A9P4SF84_9PEZI|nr:hypothetical protein M501DRAFT_1014383 [Patellaria atrata CBS 101060]
MEAEASIPQGASFPGASPIYQSTNAQVPPNPRAPPSTMPIPTPRATDALGPNVTRPHPSSVHVSARPALRPDRSLSASIHGAPSFSQDDGHPGAHGVRPLPSGTSQRALH